MRIAPTIASLHVCFFGEMRFAQVSEQARDDLRPLAEAPGDVPRGDDAITQGRQDVPNAAPLDDLDGGLFVVIGAADRIERRGNVGERGGVAGCEGPLGEGLSSERGARLSHHREPSARELATKQLAGGLEGAPVVRPLPEVPDPTLNLHVPLLPMISFIISALAVRSSIGLRYI
jgi:hypothetical protein